MSYTSEISAIMDSLVINTGQGQLVVLEGMPGSGKTTAARNLASSHGFVSVEEIDHVQHASSLTTDVCGFDKRYIRSEIARQGYVSQLLKAGRSVVQDRGFLSCLAFTYASLARLDRLDEYAWYLESIAKDVAGQILRPDVVVVLSVSVALSLRRRVNNDERYALWFDLAFLHAYEEFYHILPPQVMACSMITIDTSEETECSASERLLSGLSDIQTRRSATEQDVGRRSGI